MRAEEAKQPLVEMAPGNLSRWLLAWLPVIQGEATAAIIAGWKRKASKEPNLRDRRLLAHLTLTFAKLAEGRLKHRLFAWELLLQPSLRDSREFSTPAYPRTKVLGYSQSSLRDYKELSSHSN